MQLYSEKNKMGAIGVMRDTVKRQGYLGLYKGYSSLLLFSIPKNQVRFGTYTWAKENIFTDDSRRSNFLSGICAGAAEALLVVTPQETLKTKLIHDKLSENPKYRNVFHGMYTIGQQAGPGGMYKGAGATLMKQSSNQGVRFVVYTDTASWLSAYIDFKPVRDMLAGMFAGFCSCMANNPVDVIKTKMQGLDAHKYNGIADVAKHIIAEDGYMGFYKGVVPRLARVCLDVGLTFSIYHQLRRTIDDLVMKYQ
jgi:solute carrier family 25 (mitochondrial citrate transporter), member 1